MSNDRHDNPEASDEKPEQPTLPHIDEEDEATLMGPASERTRASVERATSAIAPKADEKKAVGMFSRDPKNVRHALPTQEESDALLDSLFEDDEPKAAAPPPVAKGARGPLAPPIAAPPPVAPNTDVETTTVGSEEDATQADADPLAELGMSESAPPAEVATEDVEATTAEEPHDFELETANGEELRPVPSVPPPAIPSRPPPAAVFDHEQDAASHLLQAQQREAWVARVEWLRAEAEATEDRATRARTLLVVSELSAMAGEEQQARAFADEARELLPNLALAHRQTRALALRDHDTAAAIEVLDQEARSLEEPRARAHALLFAAAIAKHATGDVEGAKRRVEQAARHAPADPRPFAQKLAEALAQPEGEQNAAAIAKLRVPDAPELGAFGAAFAHVLAARSIATKSPKPPSTAFEAMLAARAALASGKSEESVAALEALAAIEPIANGAAWLVGVAAAKDGATRAASARALAKLQGGTHAALARRAAAARAIEMGDAAAVRAATDEPGSESFNAADRVVLAALTGASAAEVGRWVEALIGDEELAPIASAASAAMTDPKDASRSVFAIGAPPSRAAVNLGRALATGERSSIESTLAAFADAHPDDGAARALGLELDLDGGAGDKIARAVAALRGSASADRDRLLAASIIAEVAGDREYAKSELDRAREADPKDEVIARACMAHADEKDAAKILADHAAAIDPSPGAAVLFTEAGARVAAAGDPEGAEQLFKRGAEMDPALPIASYLGERAARARGDRDGLIEWLRARREASDDAIEQAHDLVREALLTSESDASLAAQLLEQALKSRSRDAGLRELYERLAPEPPKDRAEWRDTAAAQASGVEAARLALEAALDHERAGEGEAMAKSAAKAIASGEDRLAPIVAYRAAIAGHGAGEIIDALLAKVREMTDPVEKLEVYERLAELDERGRGDAASGLLWRRTILEENPSHLPTLRKVAGTLIGAGRDDELDGPAMEIARALDGAESVAHAILAARLRLRAGNWEDTREPVEIAYNHPPRGIWALRQMEAHARAAKLHALALAVERQLLERTQRAPEAATLAIRGAQEAEAMGEIADARALLEHAITLVPKHLVAHLLLAAILEKESNWEGACGALESAAKAAASSQERTAALYKAGVLAMDKLSDAARARADLEEVSEIDPSYQDVFSRLQSLYVAAGARAELAALLKKRLDATTDPNERVEMEVLRGRALADVGDAASAKRALAAALEANPDHVDALQAFADVSASEEDWSGAEQAWIRLARLVSEPARQAQIYFRLGELYDERMPNPERAELAYQEILKREPGDARARERLVAHYLRVGDPARALEQQTVLINAAEAPEEKCRRTAELAEIYEQNGDAKKAEQTLLQARKTWPKDEVALAALATFYTRTGQAPAAQVLLDRAVADARRALSTGRFEPYLFSTIATVADLRNRPDAARIAKAAVAALEGETAELDGAGARAGAAVLDDLLAPEVVTPAFRDLLRKTGALLDQAVPFDLGAIRATPVPPQQSDLLELVRALAAGYGLPNLQVHVSNALGAVCVPASSNPPTLVFGQALLASPREDVRAFLIHRALKILATNSGAFSRTAPIDLWPLVAAYLKTWSPQWAPQGVDPAKLTDYYSRFSRLSKPNDPQLGVLAAEIIGSIGNRASTLNTIVNGWGNRAALLALGDLNVAMVAIAWAGGHTNQPPAKGKDRTTWIGRNAEARELVVFSVSDHYADARAKLGLE